MSMTAVDLVALRAAHEAFLVKWVTRGGKITQFPCPHCQHVQDAIAPSSETSCQPEGFWGGVKTCVWCGELLIARVWPTLYIEVELMPEPEGATS